MGEFPRGLILLGCVVIAARRRLVRDPPSRHRAHGGARRSPRVALVGAVAAARPRRLDGRRSAGARGPARHAGGGAGDALASTWTCPAPRRPSAPVLFYNPKSGGGKAERFALADEARERGIEPIELGPPWDLEALVRGAVERGADGLAMAGGDGSQAIVAAVAAERGLPYACIPAGTRNHFALDLGVDRDDVVGALDAFVDGGERTVDLAEVNGRVFVNNVSLGLYAEAVQHQEYRDAKLRTILDTVPDVIGPDGDGSSTCAGPGRAARATAPAPRCSCPTTATGSAGRSARARARGSTTACSA